MFPSESMTRPPCRDLGTRIVVWPVQDAGRGSDPSRARRLGERVLIGALALARRCCGRACLVLLLPACGWGTHPVGTRTERASAGEGWNQLSFSAFCKSVALRRPAPSCPLDCASLRWVGRYPRVEEQQWPLLPAGAALGGKVPPRLLLLSQAAAVVPGGHPCPSSLPRLPGQEQSSVPVGKSCSWRWPPRQHPQAAHS